MYRASPFFWSAITLAALCQTGCTGLPARTSAQLLEEQWQGFDQAYALLTLPRPTKPAPDPASDKSVEVFASNVCIGLTADCNAKVIALVREFYAEPSLAAPKPIQLSLVGVTYEAASCERGTAQPLPDDLREAARFGLAIDQGAMLEERRRAGSRAIEIRSILPESSARASESHLRRSSAIRATQTVLLSQSLIGDFSMRALRCGRRASRMQLAAELQAIVGYLSAQDLTSPITTSRFEFAHAIPPAYKVELDLLQAHAPDVRASLRNDLNAFATGTLDWARDEYEAKALSARVHQYAELMFAEAAAGAALTDLIQRAHWVHLSRVTPPADRLLALAARNIAGEASITLTRRNGCVAAALHHLGAAANLIDANVPSAERYREFVALITEARVERQSTGVCPKPRDFEFCSSAPKGSREHFRKYVAALLVTLAKETSSLEAAGDSLALDDLQTRRNVITAKFGLALKLYMQSLQSAPAC